MNPYPYYQVASAARALELVREAKPEWQPPKYISDALKAYVREPFFEHSAPILLEAASCYWRTGLKPPPVVAEWLSENAEGAWTLYLTRDLRSMIAFELDEDRVLYRLRFA